MVSESLRGSGNARQRQAPFAGAKHGCGRQAASRRRLGPNTHGPVPDEKMRRMQRRGCALFIVCLPLGTYFLMEWNAVAGCEPDDKMVYQKYKLAILFLYFYLSI
jgi:hypothetical protein